MGGSTLYVHALVEGISDLPAVPRELEEELMVEASTPEGASRLFDELTSADPRAASTVDPTKTQRLVRWVGLWRSTGRPPSSFWTSDQAPPVQTTLVVLTRPRDELYRRINTRVVQMMEDGLLDEVASVLARFPDARPTLEATIGYRELLPVLAGDRSVEEGVRLIQRNTRRYAKRQLTWYRRYPGAIWLDASETTPERLLQYVGRSSLGGRSVEHPEGHSPSPAQDENDELDS